MYKYYLVSAIIISIIICICIIGLVNKRLLVDRETFTEIVDPSLTQLVKYGINTINEAHQIVTGTWNESITFAPRASSLFLYYSVFSYDSRELLSASPFTWKNMSPIYSQRLPENCKIDDSKIVMISKPFIDTSTLGMYVNGIELHNNKANGPLAMNMGLNLASLGGNATEPQKFSIMFLLRFNNLLNLGSKTIPDNVEFLIMKANTPNNNGIHIRLDITNKNQTDHYRVNFRIAIGDGSEVVLGGFDINTQTSFYYSLSLVQQGQSVVMYMHAINMLVSEPPVLMGSISNAYINPIDFSNRPIQISGGPNITNIMAFAVFQSALTNFEVDDFVNYWKKILLKTSPVAYALCQQALTLRACPFTDSNICNACSSVTDWRNISQLITAPISCRSTYNNACLSNSSLPGCECYTVSGLSNQECITWRNLLTNTNSCPQTDKKFAPTNLITTPPQPVVRNFLTNEDYDVLTTSNIEIPKKTFFEWLFAL